MGFHALAAKAIIIRGFEIPGNGKVTEAQPLQHKKAVDSGLLVFLQFIKVIQDHSFNGALTDRAE